MRSLRDKKAKYYISKVTIGEILFPPVLIRNAGDLAAPDGPPNRTSKVATGQSRLSASMSSCSRS